MNSVQTFREANFTCLVVKFCPMLSLIMLKKHSTSSVVLALGCSGFLPHLAFSMRCHSRLSILAIAAARVSRENPQIWLLFLYIHTKEDQFLCYKHYVMHILYILASCMLLTGSLLESKSHRCHCAMALAHQAGNSGTGS